MIGDTLHIYDPYARPKWRVAVVVGETRASWLLAHDEKIDKVTMKLRGGSTNPIAMTAAQRADQEWMDQNRSAISAAIERADAALLRKVGALVGIV